MKERLTVFEFSNTNESCPIFVKDLEAANKILGPARSPKAIGSIENAEKQIKVNLEVSACFNHKDITRKNTVSTKKTIDGRNWERME